jgi:hypothetical protein
LWYRSHLLPLDHTGGNGTLTNKIVYAVDGCDLIASKNGIWKLIVDAYGREASAQLMPESFIASDADASAPF